jgi:hypothetical protein
VLAAGAAAVTRSPGDPPAWDAPTAYPDRVILTFSDDPATTQSVTWRTDTTVAAAVAQIALASPGPGFGADARTVPARSETVDARDVDDARLVARYHSVTFRDLRPDTVYAYRAGDGETWSEWYQFRTASRDERAPFAFLYFGDAQNDVLSLWSRTLRQSILTAPDARFMVHAGDLINNGQNDRQWGEWFHAGGWIHAMVPSIPATGNHEFDPLTAADTLRDEPHSVFWRPQFELPRNGIASQEESSYYVDYQGARIIALNSHREQEEQARWLDALLAQTTKAWVIVTFHHPIFSSARDRDNARLRALWQPIFDRHGVDLVLQGHDHTYARGRTFVGGTAQDSDAALGPVYVNSVGGRKQYTYKPTKWDAYDALLDRRAENTQLFQVIRIAGDTLRFRAHTATGTVYDAFDLVRRPGRPNHFIERLRGDEPVRDFSEPRYVW